MKVDIKLKDRKKHHRKHHKHHHKKHHKKHHKFHRYFPNYENTKGKYKCYLLFIIQRTDIEYFQTSMIDPIYKEAVFSAANNGVGILTLQVNWNKEDGKAYFYSNNLPIKL